MESDKKEWGVASVKCDLCGHKWVAVYQLKLPEKLECSNCENMVYYELQDNS